MQNQNLIKKIIIALIILVIGVGIFFGVTFYQASKATQTATRGGSNTNPTRTPFQTRVATGSDITIIQDQATPTTEIENPTPTVNLPTEEPRLVELWKAPTSGFDFINKDIQVLATTTRGTSTVTITKTLKNQPYIYLWDRATGNIYENLASTSVVVRISNFTSPEVQEAFFITPTTVVTRELDSNNESIITSYIQLAKETSSSTLFTATKKRIYLNSEHISISQDNKKMFYILKDSGQAFVSNTDMSSVLRVLTTNITQWLPQYVNKATLALTTKPSAYYPGYLFFLNASGTEDNQYILGDKYGFTTLVSPDGSKVLYNEILDDSLLTSIYNTKTKTSITLSQATLSEKCVWSNDSKRVYCAIPQQLNTAPYPDVWYQGLTSFSDNIWSIDSGTGQFELEIALQDQLTVDIDAYNLKISADQKYLLFQDKYSLHLWKYRL